MQKAISPDRYCWRVVPPSHRLLNLVINDEVLDMVQLVSVLINADQTCVVLHGGYQDCILLRHSGG